MTALAEIELVGARELETDLRDLDERLHRDATEPLTDIAEQLAEIVRRQLQAAVGMPPLSPTTIEMRRRRGQGGAAPLIASGALLGSITHSADKEEASAGTNLLYGRLQQFGFTTGASSAIPGKVVPARPFALIDDADADRIEEQLVRFLLGDELAADA